MAVVLVSMGHFRCSLSVFHPINLTKLGEYLCRVIHIGPIRVVLNRLSNLLKPNHSCT